MDKIIEQYNTYLNSDHSMDSEFTLDEILNYIMDSLHNDDRLEIMNKLNKELAENPQTPSKKNKKINPKA